MNKLLSDNIRVIAFDADDTLWDNQTLYDEAENQYCRILAPYGTEQQIRNTLFKVESSNMPTMGYGTKAFTLSLIQNALEMSHDTIPTQSIHEILRIGTKLLHNPATPFPQVQETLTALRQSNRYTLVCFTKGDLLDQQNKFQRSGLLPLFHHVEISSEKSAGEYLNLCDRFQITPAQLLMVGNSFKSDIHPVIELGGHGIYIPYKRTWQYEHLAEYKHERVIQISHFTEILNWVHVAADQ